MADSTKPVVPPYATYQSFANFINALREHGMPKHITRSILPGSNSGKASMSATLGALGLVNEKDEPTPIMRQLTDSKNDYGKILNQIITESYPFLRDKSLDLSDTTTDKVTEKFKELGAGGSTITKCTAFLLGAAKDAGMQVSRYVKTPLPPTRATKKRHVRSAADDGPDTADALAKPLGVPEGKERIVVSVHGMEDWEIFVPKGLTAAQWKHGLKMANFILSNYRPAENNIKVDEEKEEEDEPF